MTTTDVNTLHVVAHQYRPGGGGFCNTCGQGPKADSHVDVAADASPEPVITTERPPEIAMVTVAKIQFHRRNIRRDLGDLRELTASIRADGLLQPILVHRVAGGLQLVDGHRRIAAARLGGVKRVPAVILNEQTDDQVITKALATGLLKQDISVDERRVAVRALMHEFNYTAEQIGEQLGVAASTVYSWSAKPKTGVRSGTRFTRTTVGISRVRAVVDEWRDRPLTDDARELLADVEALISAGQIDRQEGATG